MSFLTWLESGGFGEWVRSSYIGYPTMIACHAIGMAIMVGLALALATRLLGFFVGIPYAAVNRFLGIAWAGFALNFLSGSALFAAQATTYITDGTFLLKMAFVVAGMSMVAVLQRATGRDSHAWHAAAAPGGVKFFAGLSIGCWVMATITGRLIAYI